MNLRYVSALVLKCVLQRHSLTDCLKQYNSASTPRDKAFVQAVAYGVCRYLPRLDFFLQKLLSKPLSAKDQDIYSLLLIGLFQLSVMKLPDYAAVTETVNAAVDFKKIWAKRLINAVLRNYLRQQVGLEEEADANETSLYAHPAWWITSIKKAWPSEWQTILKANNEEPPFTLRVNQQKLTRESYLQALKGVGIEAEIAPHTLQGITLKNAMMVDKLPGFLAGHVSVQDGASQLVAPLLNLTPDLRVLDACAAPGGKLTHLAELEPHFQYLLAVEKNKDRIKMIKENLTRLNLNATCLQADVGDVKTWWDKQLFDRILLDAPCSSSGVIRRHPDIKLLRQANDLQAFAKTQLNLLKSLWLTLAPNGLILYTTCSIFPQENDDVIQQFLKDTPGAQIEPIETAWGINTTYGKQILPGEDGMDGFYYCRMRKVT